MSQRREKSHLSTGVLVGTLMLAPMTASTPAFAQKHEEGPEPSFCQPELQPQEQVRLLTEVLWALVQMESQEGRALSDQAVVRVLGPNMNGCGPELFDAYERESNLYMRELLSNSGSINVDLAQVPALIPKILRAQQMLRALRTEVLSVQ